MKAQIVCRPRAGKTLTFVLGAEECILGREPRHAVSLPLEGVSRRHARITWDGRFHWLEDLGSTNGTFLNGQAVRRERLRHLDVITLGKQVDLVFALRSEELQRERTQGIVRAALRADDGEGEEHEIPAGEVMLGRSSACNVVIESGAVSKVHARVERRLTQLVIEDLGSSNGTFVNGVRAASALLHDGDLVSLGGVVGFRVRVELGEVTASSGARSRADWLPAAAASQSRSRAQFGSDWRTRFEWGSGEIAQLEDLRRGGAAQGPPRPGGAPPRGKTKGVPVVAPAPSRGAPAPSPPAPAPAPAAGRAPAPPSAAPPRPAATPPVPAVRPVPPAAARPAPPAPAAPPPAAAPEAPVAPAPPAPTAAAGPSAAPRATTAARAPIAEVRLQGSGFDLALGETGAHQLGRAVESRLLVDHPTVSRRHARVILAEDRSTAYVQDLGGANGTWVNGQPIEALAPLAEGDRIRIGDVELVTRIIREPE